jgi:hypothetical protein
MAAGDPLLVLASVLGLAIDCACHVLVARWTSGRRLALAVVLGIGAGAIVTVACTLIALGRPGGHVLEATIWVAFNLLIYVALAYGYFNFFNLNVASLRLRILAELLERHQGLTEAELTAEYNASELLDKRLARLVRLEQLVERDGRLHYHGCTLLWVANVLDQVKRFLVGRTNRFAKAWSKH